MRLEKVDVYREDITKVNHVAWELFTVPTQHCQCRYLVGLFFVALYHWWRNRPLHRRWGIR
jgi:hypothetical protein